MYEMPPILHGSTQDQINDLRDYLVRLVERLEQQEMDDAPAAPNRSKT